MLSDVDVDNLIMPLLSRQEELNRKILVKMADRIKQIGELSATDLHSLEQLYRQGEDIKQINKWLADYTGMQQKDIKKIIKASAQDVYEDAKPFYKNKQITQIPFVENKTLQMYIQAIANNTNNTFMNLSNAAAFMLRDPADPTKLVATPIAKAYQEVIDKAVQASSEGFVDYNTAMRDSMRELINSGIYIPVGTEKKVQYQAESERIHYQRLDTAVRRNVLDGIRATNQMTQQLVGDEFGADGYEITVHSSPAPDHAEIQGHQFTKEQYERMQNGEDFKDVKGKFYMSIKRKIGQWNCKHFAYAIVIGVATPIYTDDELQEIIDKNNVGYTAPNGKHFTTYECTQKMRQMETEIRKLRDGKVVAEHSGDSVLADEYRIRINKRRNEYKAFAKAAGLKPRLDNTRITNPLPKKSIKAQGNPNIPPVFGGQSFNIS